MIAPALSLLTFPLLWFSSAILASPALVLRDGGPPDTSVCEPTCEFLCTKFTMHTLSIDGTTKSSMYAGKNLKVTYDGEDVCPEQQHNCDAGKSCDFHFDCKQGWSFYLPDQSMEGPWKYDLQGLPFTRYYTSDNPDGNMDVTMDDIDCDGYDCGGGEMPMYCRNCAVHSEHKFWTAEKTCDLPS